jgi:hypothetical protein
MAKRTKTARDMFQQFGCKNPLLHLKEVIGSACQISICLISLEKMEAYMSTPSFKCMGVGPKTWKRRWCGTTFEEHGSKLQLMVFGISVESFSSAKEWPTPCSAIGLCKTEFPVGDVRNWDGKELGTRWKQPITMCREPGDGAVGAMASGLSMEESMHCTLGQVTGAHSLQSTQRLRHIYALDLSTER